MSKFAQLLRQAREKRGWTTAIVAAQLSVPRSLVELWEQEKIVPSQVQRTRVYRLLVIDESMVEDSPDPQTQREEYGDTAFLLLPNSETGDTRLLTAGNTPVSFKEQETVIYDPDLPLARGHLIGREGLLGDLKQRLEEGSRIGLYGLPGSGKTALAVALAHDSAITARFHDGVIWAGFGQQPHMLGLFSHWGELLGIDVGLKETPKSADAWAAALRNAIGQRRLLIVMDDVWNLEDAQACLIGGANCAYLLTTRNRQIAASFAGQGAIAVPELAEQDGLTLLTQFTPPIISVEGETLQQLVHSVGGLPLALTLMGKYLRTQAVGGQRRRVKSALHDLQDILYRLHLSTSTAPSEHPPHISEAIPISLHSVIAVSDQQLDELSRQVLRALSILPTKPNAFDQEVALAVGGEPIETLDILCRAGLLEQIGLQRYMLHQTIADYARVQLETSEPQLRLIRYTQNSLLKHQREGQVLKQDLSTIIFALEYAYKEGWQQELVQCSCLAAPVLILRGFYPLAEQVLLRAYTAARQLADEESYEKIAFYLGTISQKQGEYARARELYQEGLVLARRHNDQEQICSLLVGLGALAKEQGQYADAEAFYEEGLELAQELQDQEKICSLLIGLGVMARERGHYEQARNLYTGGLALARQRGDSEQTGTALRYLGIVASEQGNYAQAEVYYQEGLGLAQQLEHRDLTSNILMNLGNLAKERGQYSQAENYLQESLALARQMGHQERISVLLSNLGVLEDARSDYAQAEAYLHEGLEVARKVGHPERISLILLNLGVVVGRQGRDEQAEHYYQEALTLARELGHRERISLLLLNLGDIAIGQNNVEQARMYLKEGMQLARHMRHQERISDLLLHLGILAIRQGEERQAETYLQEGLQIAQQINKPLLICTQLNSWGDLLLLKKQFQEARQVFQDMLELAPPDSQKVVADAQYGLARVAASLQEYDRARELAQSGLSILNAIGHRSANSIQTFLERLPKRRDSQL